MLSTSPPPSNPAAAAAAATTTTTTTTTAAAAAAAANSGAEIKAGIAIVEELQGLENSYSHTLVKVVRFRPIVICLKLSCFLMLLLVQKNSATVTTLTSS